MMAAKDGNNITGQTLREIVHTSVGGQQTRIWLSNRFGNGPLYIGAAHVALSGAGRDAQTVTFTAGAIQPGSDRVVTFHHHPFITIPPGATVVSDPVELTVPAFADLAVSLYFPKPTAATTYHELASQFSFATTGNMVGEMDLGPAAWKIGSWYFLTGVDVDAPGVSALVTLGDSITDGSRSKFNANERWPDFLAKRLAADPAVQKAGVLGVVNVGIAGNEVLMDGFGPNAVSRINWDVLTRSGARYLIVLEGINDITRYANNHQPYGDLAQRLEQSYAQIATQAHLHGFRVFGATLTPFQGCPCYTPEGSAVRHQLNQWIRTTHVYDGVIDFDRAVRDPVNPERYLPRYDSDDHIHPSKAGYQAMANAIDLTLFVKAEGKP
jgi:lysophospholipase L1-like esterase